MGKQIIYTCDVCGVQIEDDSVSNVAVVLSSSGSMSPLSDSYDTFVCEDCAAKKLSSEIFVAVSDVAKKAKNMIVVAAITLKAVNVDGTIKGIAIKKSAVDPAPAQPQVIDKVQLEADLTASATAIINQEIP